MSRRVYNSREIQLNKKGSPSKDLFIDLWNVLWREVSVVVLVYLNTQIYFSHIVDLAYWWWIVLWRVVSRRWC